METLQVHKLSSTDCDNILSLLLLEEKRWIVEVFSELKSARRKHPEWPLDIVHRAAIVGEESGELTKATLQAFHESGEWEGIHKEAIQTASTALRLLIETPVDRKEYVKAWKQSQCVHKYQVTGEGHNKQYYRCSLCGHETND